MPNLRLPSFRSRERASSEAVTTAPPSSPPVAEPVTVEGVHKAFGPATVLQGADLALEPGRIVALLGPSGCGKTTLLRCIAGLERPDAGTIRVGGRTLVDDTGSMPAERRRIGMVFQDWALFPHLSVAANVGYGLRRTADRRTTVEAALGMVDLAGCGDRLPGNLSGGQQQRVALARALATRPGVLLLDEPFSNLDAGLRVSIRADVRDLLERLGTTALFVTHDQEEAFVVGDEVAVMLGGRVVQQSLPADLYAAPVSRDVASFIGDANLLDGAARGDRATTAFGPVPLRGDVHGAVDVLVRPEQLTITVGDTAVVDHLDYYGHDVVYHLRADGGARIRVRVLDTPRYRPGDRVDVGYHGEPTAAYVRS